VFCFMFMLFFTCGRLQLHLRLLHEDCRESRVWWSWSIFFIVIICGVGRVVIIACSWLITFIFMIISWSIKVHLRRGGWTRWAFRWSFIDRFFFVLSPKNFSNLRAAAKIFFARTIFILSCWYQKISSFRKVIFYLSWRGRQAVYKKSWSCN